MTLAVSIAQGGSNNVTFRNKIINGACVIDQRNAGASVTANNSGTQYTLDRWTTYGNPASKFTIQQNAGSVTPPAGFSNYLGITSSSAYSIAAGDIQVLGQLIEGFNTYDLAWGTSSASAVTLSFWVYSSLTGTFGGGLLNSAQNYSYPFSYSIPSANTWTKITVNIAGPTTGTWIGATNGIGIRVNFSVGTGSTASGTAGAWASGSYYSATGATSVVGTNGATWYVTGVQLEAGTTASPFEYRQYGTELLLCQRYYETTAYPDVTFTTAATRAGVCFTGGNNSSGFSFLVPKRSNSPTVTLYSRNNTSGAVSLVATGAEVTGTTASGICGTGFRCTQLGSAQTVSAGIETAWVASSEL